METDFDVLPDSLLDAADRTSLTIERVRTRIALLRAYLGDVQQTWAPAGAAAYDSLDQQVLRGSIRLCDELSVIEDLLRRSVASYVETDERNRVLLRGTASDPVSIVAAVIAWARPTERLTAHPRSVPYPDGTVPTESLTAHLRIP